jgi:frataxin-like iron-binding protein CyaY
MATPTIVRGSGGIILVEEDEPSYQEWLHAAMQGGAFDFLNAPDEDRYTLRDGKPFDDAR